MKTMIRLVLLLLAIGSAPAANAANEQQRSIEAAANGSVSISNVSGSIEVSGWARNQVDVAADLGWGVEELVVERDGDNVIIQVKAPKQSGRDVSTQLIIRVPEKSSLDIGAVSADIDVVDVSGEQRLHSVSGDISTQAFAADIQAEVVSGDIELVGHSEKNFVQLSSVSGDIDVSGLNGDIEVSSVSGDLSVANSTFNRVQANNVSGDVELRAELTEGGRMDVETINGSIDLHFVGNIDARFDIETFNGSIRNCFGPKPERSSQYTPGRELKFTEGSGRSRVTLRTLNGSLDMCRD